MVQHGVMYDLGIALVAALIGGLIARKLRLPVLTGYLVAGIVVGPHTPGIFARPDTVGHVAELGVALLMFAVGVHFSMKELTQVWRTAIFGGSIQITGTILLGFAVALILKRPAYEGLFLGCALALSSTAVMMKLLEERGELGTSHGRVMLGILIVQDFAIVAMAVLLPAISVLASGGEDAWKTVGLALLRSLGFIAATLVLAVYVVPKFLDRVVRSGSRELFLLTVVSLCIAAATAAHYAGLGVELGAFIAGLMISETEHSLEAFSQIRPLRDVFASIFFVSVGMLLDPGFLVKNAGAVALIVAAIVVGKSIISAFAAFVFGWHGRTAILVGLGLGQIGEFSFVLATLGASRDLVSPDLAGLIVSCALVSLFTAPFLYRLGDPIYGMLSRTSLASLLNRQRVADEAPEEPTAPGPRVLVLGFGRIGRLVTTELMEAGFAPLVIEYDALAVDDARCRGVPVLYGDASSEAVLTKAGPERASLVIVTLPDASDTTSVVRTIKRVAPNLPMIVRTHRESDVAYLTSAGADVVIHPELEAGSKMVREAHRLLHSSGSPTDVWQRAL